MITDIKWHRTYLCHLYSNIVKGQNSTSILLPKFYYIVFELLVTKIFFVLCYSIWAYKTRIKTIENYKTVVILFKRPKFKTKKKYNKEFQYQKNNKKTIKRKRTRQRIQLRYSSVNLIIYATINFQFPYAFPT